MGEIGVVGVVVPVMVDDLVDVCDVAVNGDVLPICGVFKMGGRCGPMNRLCVEVVVGDNSVCGTVDGDLANCEVCAL